MYHRRKNYEEVYLRLRVPTSKNDCLSSRWKDILFLNGSSWKKKKITKMNRNGRFILFYRLNDILRRKKKRKIFYSSSIIFSFEFRSNPSTFYRPFLRKIGRSRVTRSRGLRGASSYWRENKRILFFITMLTAFLLFHRRRQLLHNEWTEWTHSTFVQFLFLHSCNSWNMQRCARYRLIE